MAEVDSLPFASIRTGGGLAALRSGLPTRLHATAWIGERYDACDYWPGRDDDLYRGGWQKSWLTPADFQSDDPPVSSPSLKVFIPPGTAWSPALGSTTTGEPFDIGTIRFAASADQPSSLVVTNDYHGGRFLRVGDMYGGPPGKRTR